VTPIHSASYATLMTIIAADVRTPIVTVPPIAIVTIGTMGIAVVAIPVAIISAAIYTPIMSIVGLRLVHGH
jgi:hypothetical protein